MQLNEKFLAEFLDLDEAEVTRWVQSTNDRTINDLVVERHKKKMQALAAALTSEDDLGKVVRGHIHIEHELRQVIFFASPSRTHLKSFESQEYSEKVRLALILGLKADLAPALNAAGKLRNKFAHRLNTTLNKEIAKNLATTLPSTLKTRFEGQLNVMSQPPEYLIAQIPPALRADLEARLGRSLLELGHPREWLEGEARTLAEARIHVITFFLCLFEGLANERHRFAYEKIQRMNPQMGAAGDGPVAR